MKQFLSSIKKTIKAILLASKNDKLRAIYWNLRAKDINEQWGEGQSDFEVINRIINFVKPKSLLDIGCGSGRLFPLYNGISKVYAQDISKVAIKLCQKRYPGSTINYLKKHLKNLNFKNEHFDLIISNRVLSAIIPKKIELILKQLIKLTKYIYINELTDSDYNGEQSDYWFKHDYLKILFVNNFELIETGMINKQTWYLFKKNPQ